MFDWENTQKQLHVRQIKKRKALNVFKTVHEYLNKLGKTRCIPKKRNYEVKLLN